MANIKFSAFTSGATTANTRIVGYDSTGNTNNQYDASQLVNFVLDGTLSGSRTLTMGAYDLNLASTTAGQQVKFSQNVEVEGQGFTELHAQTSNDLQFNWNNGNVQTATGLTGSHTFTAQNPKAGATYIITLAQTGTVTATWTGVKWPAATAPTLSGTGKTDVVTLICYDATGAGLYYGSATLDLA